MITPFYATCAASAAVKALLGDPPRIYVFGRNTAPVGQRVYPYVTYQSIGGAPENYLHGRPDADRVALQVDVWGKDAAVIAAAQAIRDAIELSCYITAWRGESIDPDTGSHRISFDADWIVQR